ncbi:MAG TPA: type II secretion system F family protein [Gemmatimonadaceae bacterium]|nr:type II secretion system F family protein [Gemmatimonadaceae bacterium]
MQDRGWYPVKVGAATRLAQGKRTIPLGDLALGLRVLATLLDAGLSVKKTLTAFDDLAPESWGAGLAPMRDAVRDGKTLADALASSPLKVPPVVIGIIHAGEAGSGIAPAVLRAAEIIERSTATRAAIRGALAYPALLAIAGSLSMALLVGVVLPRFAAILTGLNQTLPRTTRIVLGAAAVMRIAAIPALICAAGLLVAWMFWTKTERGRAEWHAFLFALPFVGDLRRSAATSRAAAALASLLESGVPLASALPYAARASGDAAEEAMLSAARELIVHGERPSIAFKRTGSLTSTAVRLVRAGEESGRLARMLDHAALLEATRTEETIREAVRLLEPALILAFGGAVALVAAALLQAIYSVRPG